MVDIIYKELSYQIMDAAYTVHNTLGIGFLEKAYENTLMIELQKRNIKCQQQAPIKVYYEGAVVGDYKADILVEDKVILEIKVVKELSEVHDAQLMNYLKATDLKLGILLNFANAKVKSKRIVM